MKEQMAGTADLQAYVQIPFSPMWQSEVHNINYSHSFKFSHSWNILDSLYTHWCTILRLLLSFAFSLSPTVTTITSLTQLYSFVQPSLSTPALFACTNLSAKCNLCTKKNLFMYINSYFSSKISWSSSLRQLRLNKAFYFNTETFEVVTVGSFL